jgi:hypothetical protein
VIGYLHYDAEGAEPELHRIYVNPDEKRGGVGGAASTATATTAPLWP